MRIKMKTVMAGPDGTAYPGQEIVVADGRGQALVAGGFATEIVPPAPAPPAPETPSPIGVGLWTGRGNPTLCPILKTHAQTLDNPLWGIV